jgi:CheY-like chemotaxis protein
VETRVTPLILVVEDELLVRIFIAEALRECGHRVVEAATGEEALAFLEQNQEPICLLFTDIQLGGGLDGWDVAEAFRGANPHIPVLYASGNSPDRRRQVAGSVFFDKPYLPTDIFDAIDRVAA